MATGTDIASRVRELINDVATDFVSGLRWTDPELIRWINLAQREIVKLKPEANAVTEVFTVAGGVTRQRLDPTTSYRLIRVEANGRDNEGEAEDVPPVITSIVENTGPNSLTVNWSAATFGSGEVVDSYDLLRTDAQTYQGGPNFSEPLPESADLSLGGQVGGETLTYEDEASNDYMNVQYGFIIRAIGAGGSELYSEFQPSNGVS